MRPSGYPFDVSVDGYPVAQGPSLFRLAEPDVQDPVLEVRSYLLFIHLVRQLDCAGDAAVTAFRNKASITSFLFPYDVLLSPYYQTPADKLRGESSGTSTLIP